MSKPNCKIIDDVMICSNVHETISKLNKTVDILVNSSALDKRKLKKASESLKRVKRECEIGV